VSTSSSSIESQNLLVPTSCFSLKSVLSSLLGLLKSLLSSTDASRSARDIVFVLQVPHHVLDVLENRSSLPDRSVSASMNQVVATKDGKAALAICTKKCRYLDRNKKPCNSGSLPLEDSDCLIRMAVVSLDKWQMSVAFRIAAWIVLLLSAFMAAITIFLFVLPTEYHDAYEQLLGMSTAIILSVTTIILFIAIVKSMNLGRVYQWVVIAATFLVFVLSAIMIVFLVIYHSNLFQPGRYRVCFNDIANNREAMQTPLANISVGTRPNSIAITSDQSKAYVSNQWNASVSVINMTTYEVIANIAVCAGPRNVTLTPDGKEVWVSNEYNNTVSVIDVETNEVTATIPVGFAPGKILFATTSQGDNRAYVLNYGNATISIVDRDTYRVVIRNVTVGLFPVDVVVAASTWLYVVCAGDIDVWVIDINNDQDPVQARIPVVRDRNY
jgi:YVTN family beta-propeller protein